MLLGTFGANILTGRGAIAKRQVQGINRSSEGIVRAGYDRRSSKNKRMDFQCRLILWQILLYKNIIKMNLNLMAFILDIIYPK